MASSGAVYLLLSFYYPDSFEQIYEKRRGGYKYENFIIWKRNK